MKWFAKAITFQVLSRVPGGTAIHHGLQRITGGNRQTPERLEDKIRQTARYWRWLEDNNTPGWLASASHLDLGTGWLPSIPVTFYGFGVQKQYLVDIKRHMEPGPVAETIALFRSVVPRTGIQFKRLPEIPKGGLALEAILEPLGMTYAAPYDELAARIAGTVGFVTATHTLHWMNRPTMLSVSKAVHHLLAPGGYFLSQQHMRQLFYGLNDPEPFHGLRYSEWFWENVVNSSMMSYNRLKARDYEETLKEAGFEITLSDVEPGTSEDFKKLDGARIHPMFSRYTREELAARHLFLVARKPL
jgi:hypothetical protein